MVGTGTSELVEKLVAEDHAIEVCARDDAAEKRQALVRAIGYDLVHVKFPHTKGGTEIGLRLQRDLCDDLDRVADPENGPERLRIVGDLTLDWVPIRVTAEFSLKSFAGTARVEKRPGEAAAE